MNRSLATKAIFVSLILFPILFMVLYSDVTRAETIEVEYKTFYSHVRKLNNEDTQALQFAFGFVNIHSKALCQIESARISTDKKQIPLEVSEENRFTVPTERALRLADALVIIDIVEQSNHCDISVQLETKPEYLKANYSFEELAFLFEQYEAFFNEMGSFMSFMMPSVNGLMLQFRDETLSTKLSNGYEIIQGNLKLDKAFFENGKPIRLPEAPLRVTAVTSS
uniref:DUF2987 domain-containing protein n=1 Tax=Ningiella ruwaisensis TaxID=2364274 RepID=UPI003BAB1F60